MISEMITTIATFIATQVRKQPNRIISTDEALISKRLIDSFSLLDLALFVITAIVVYIPEAVWFLINRDGSHF